MPASLNIRNIGEDRKKSVEFEARLRGASVADVVRDWIDEGIARSRAARAQDAWIAAAKGGIESEMRDLEENGPSLARFRAIRET